MRSALLIALLSAAAISVVSPASGATEPTGPPKIVSVKRSGTSLSATIRPDGSITNWQLIERYEQTCRKKEQPCKGEGYEGAIEASANAPGEVPQVKYVTFDEMNCSTRGTPVEKYAYRIKATNLSGTTYSKWISCNARP